MPVLQYHCKCSCVLCFCPHSYSGTESLKFGDDEGSAFIVDEECLAMMDGDEREWRNNILLGS